MRWGRFNFIFQCVRFPSRGVAAARLGYLSHCLVGSSHGSARHLEPKPEEQPTINKSPRCQLSNVSIVTNVSMRSTVSVSSVFIQIMESMRSGSPITNLHPTNISTGLGCWRPRLQTAGWFQNVQLRLCGVQCFKASTWNQPRRSPSILCVHKCIKRPKECWLC